MLGRARNRPPYARHGQARDGEDVAGLALSTAGEMSGAVVTGQTPLCSLTGGAGLVAGLLSPPM